MKKSNDPLIPADVPHAFEHEYLTNYAAITQESGNLMLFACDQKIEHLNNDFVGETIAPEAASVEHLFAIAQQGTIGAMAAHFGLIARYGKKYPTVHYIVKLNGKTDLISPQQHDPRSSLLWTVEDVLALKKHSGLAIAGIGYTIYLGSEYEHVMLAQAAQVVHKAHAHGLVALLWIYPRGRYITQTDDSNLAAGAAGVATALGADFVKIKAPKKLADLVYAVKAAGSTKIICSGGASLPVEQFLQELSAQLEYGACGSATGRNIFQKPFPQAIALTTAIAAMVINKQNITTALQIYQQST